MIRFLKKLTVTQIFEFLLTLVLLGVILNVYIKSAFSITHGNIFSLYKDMLILLFIVFSIATFSIKTNSMSLNNYDLLFLCFLMFGLFQIINNYVTTNSLISGIYKFRRYLLTYVLYFCFVSFFKINSKYFDIAIKIAKLIVVISFLWSITESLAVNTKIIPIASITSFLRTSIILENDALYQVSHKGENYLPRTYGVIADVSLSGVFYLIGLMAFAPESIQKNKTKDTMFILLGITAILTSTSKTALFLLFVISPFMLSIKSRKSKYFKILILLLACATFMLYNKTIAFRGMVDATIFTAVPVYIEQLQSDISNASLFEILFGRGYDVKREELLLLGLQGTVDENFNWGNDLLFVNILMMWGIIGFVMYATIFIFYPLVLFYKAKSTFIKGTSLSVIVAGLSSVHNNAIFHSGIDIIVCLFLACMSYAYYKDKPSKNKQLISGCEKSCLVIPVANT
ncbi:membrane protein [Candidatus Magnetobacterium bavaricum]|uniref:Membrane protein n=1 Tax=Candidatus Magnetobacterium bavaricum TaxID=29290 RepID=A0A0F3GHA8_9BACT|nr:membrane protein [Candidatus Magnetobacterium bavaricum]